MQRSERSGDWKATLQEAHDLRVQAHEADQDHADPAWEAENAKTNNSAPTHDQLMAFYRKQLAL